MKEFDNYLFFDSDEEFTDFYVQPSTSIATSETGTAALAILKSL